MTSTLSWLDVSDRERRQALDIIDLFRTHDTRDELGLGAIRDGFSDAFFPGTSTIQTRAVYFLLIPWTYRMIEEKYSGTSNIGARARRHEVRLIDKLVASGDLDGVIGQQARKSLKRLPSEVYWSGLRSWGIRVARGSREQYHRQIEYGQLGGAPTKDLEADGERRVRSGWHPNLPDPPSEFPHHASLALRPQDADYLAERIQLTAPGTLLAHLVEQPKLHKYSPFVWDYPAVDGADEPTTELIEQAKRFSELLNGAPLLYNWLIAVERDREELVIKHAGELDRWADRRANVPWDRAAFWDAVETTQARVDPKTRAFVNDWTALIGDLRAERLQESSAAKALIRNRERDVKGHQVRLGRPEALWGGDAGTGQLDFRWSTAWVLLRDISAGRGPSDA